MPRLVVGRVIGPDSKGIAGAEVAGASVSPSQDVRPVRAITDRSGAFRIEGIDPKAEVTLTARRGDLISASQTSTRAGGDTVTIALSQGLTVEVSGRVVGPDGSPIADAAVRINSRRLGVPVDPRRRRVRGHRRRRAGYDPDRPRWPVPDPSRAPARPRLPGRRRGRRACRFPE